MSWPSVALAWVVILACVGLKFSLGEADAPVTEPEVAAEIVQAEAAHAPETPWAGFKTIMTARMVLLMEKVDAMNPQAQGMGVKAQLEPLMKSEWPFDRIVAAALLARTGNYDKAREVAADAISRAEAMAANDHRESVVALAQSVGRVVDAITPESAGSVDVAVADREVIKERLGWIGDLLLSRATTDPVIEAEVSAIPMTLGLAIGAFLLFAGVAGIVGCVWLGVLVVRANRRRLELSCQGASRGGASIIWIFSGWFAITLGMAWVADEVLDVERSLSGSMGLMLQIAAMALPMIALGIPTLSGVSWSQTRRDIGLHRGAGLWREACHGLLVYATAIPLLVIGVTIAIIMSAVAGGGIEEASHPIQEAMANGDAAQRAILYVIAAILAPLIEEILFRGALYRHLRELTQAWGAAASIAVGALASSLLFAAIHPQGVFFIPILGSLAVAFCLGRETRGSLIAPMVAHGLNNAIILTVGIFVAG